MAEYIEREDAINLLWLFAEESCASVVSDFEALPTAAVEPVRKARWIFFPRAHYFKCGFCRQTVPYKKAVLHSGKREYNYCPNCGAKMDGEGET